MAGKTESVDVLIVGGGMVGASLAVALAPLPLRVAVIEAFDPRGRSQPSYDDRSTAIANGSKRIFETIGVWGGMAKAATPILSIHVSDRGRFGITRISAAEENVPALGYVVPNRTIGDGLWTSLERQQNVSVFCPARLQTLSENDAQVTAGIETGDGAQTSVTTRLLVAADGASSVVRQLLGVSATVWDYGQSAIISNVSTEIPHRNAAFERFTDNGPIAILPMSEGRCGIVWTVPAAQADDVLALDDAQILTRLQSLFGYRLGHWEKIGKRFAYPLSMVRADEQTRPRIVIAGNAAHGLHPIAGQGFNLSLRDVAALAEIIADADDPGADAVLNKYRQMRTADQARVIGFTDGLVRVFGNPLMSIKTARNLGLLVFDLLPGAKSQLARHTMGRGGDLPRLARGIPLT